MNPNNNLNVTTASNSNHSSSQLSQQQQQIYTQPYTSHTQTYKPHKPINPYETDRLNPYHQGYQPEEKHDYNTSDYSPPAENPISNHHNHNSILPHQILPTQRHAPQEPPTHFKQHYSAPTTTYNTNMHTPTAAPIPTPAPHAPYYMAPQTPATAVPTAAYQYQPWHNTIATGGSHMGYATNRIHTTPAPASYHQSAMVYPQSATNYSKYQVPGNATPVMTPGVYNHNSEHLRTNRY